MRGLFITGLNVLHAVTYPHVDTVTGLQAVAHGAWDHLNGRYGARTEQK